MRDNESESFGNKGYRTGKMKAKRQNGKPEKREKNFGCNGKKKDFKKKE